MTTEKFIWKIEAQGEYYALAMANRVIPKHNLSGATPRASAYPVSA